MSNVAYLKVLHPAPVLNRPDFATVFGDTLLRDHVGVRALEFVALPETYFTVIKTISECVFQVTTEDYPTESPLFIDIKFCRDSTSLKRRPTSCPPKDQILLSMYRMLGLPYVWGGNYHQGIEKMDEWYPLPHSITNQDRELWLMKGVDCSGLLYDATHGYTPRNTSTLVRYGAPVAIEERPFKDWISELQPLDLIVWGGHVVIIYDKDVTIESRHPKGVILTPIKERLSEILQDRTPVNNYSATAQIEKRFVIRRWI